MAASTFSRSLRTSPATRLSRVARQLNPSTQHSPFGNQNEIYDSGKGMGKLMDDPVLVGIGKKHGKSGAQVALAWGIAHGQSVIPKSKTESRIQSNFEGDFELPQEDVAKINAIDKKMRFNDPSGSFGWEFYKGLDGKKK